MTPRELWSLFRRLLSLDARPRAALKPLRRQLHLDVLEDRTVPSTLSSLEVGPPELAPLTSSLDGDMLAASSSDTTSMIFIAPETASTTGLRIRSLFQPTQIPPIPRDATGFAYYTAIVPVEFSMRDSTGNVASDYRGRVNIWATLDGVPSRYKFTAADAGSVVFFCPVTLVSAPDPSNGTPPTGTTGPESSWSSESFRIVASVRKNLRTVVAFDLVVGISAEVVRVNGVHIDIREPFNLQPGGGFDLPVLIVDGNGQAFPSYQGTLDFSLTDMLTGTALPVANYGLPDTYTFTLTDAGAHFFPVNPLPQGQYKIVARDTATGMRASRVIVNVPPPAPSPAEPFPGGVYAVIATEPLKPRKGKPFEITVQMFQENAVPFTGYTGTITLETTRPIEGLPAAYTFTADDEGTATFFPVIARFRKRFILIVRESLDSTIRAKAEIRVF